MGVTRHPLFDDSGRLPGVPVDASVARRLRRNLAEVLARDPELVARFYARLFAARPDLRRHFGTDLRLQACRVRAGLALLVARLDRPEELARELSRLRIMHRTAGVRPEDLPCARDCLLDALREAAGDRLDPDLDREWRRVLEVVVAALGADRDSAPRSVQHSERPRDSPKTTR